MGTTGSNGPTHIQWHQIAKEKTQTLALTHTVNKSLVHSQLTQKHYLTGNLLVHLQMLFKDEVKY